MISRILDWFRLHRLKRKKGAAYSRYLDLQFNRSRSKRAQNSPKEILRKEHLVGIAAKCVNLRDVKNALVIGCRDSSELDLLESRGVLKTTGIDLFSHDGRILVMDMHKLDFDDGAFDLIYCSHALEHAHDPRQVCSEMARVLKKGGHVVLEVPTNYEVRGADMHDFRSAADLVDIFADFGKADVLFSEDVSKEDNDSGTDVARLIIEMQ